MCSMLLQPRASFSGSSEIEEAALIGLRVAVTSNTAIATATAVAEDDASSKKKKRAKRSKKGGANNTAEADEEELPSPAVFVHCKDAQRVVNPSAHCIRQELRWRLRICYLFCQDWQHQGARGLAAHDRSKMFNCILKVAL